MHDDEFAEMVRQASARPEVRRAVGELYASVQREVEARRPRCDLSGRCCRFEEYGHRLFVTTMELAAFAHDLGHARESGRLPARAVWNGTGCPFQVAKLCGVHSIRPFGCRMFFCDATATDWQHQTYERFHADLRRLHDELAVPYRYIEWRAALRALGMDGATPNGPTEAALQPALSPPPESF